MLTLFKGRRNKTLFTSFIILTYSLQVHPFGKSEAEGKPRVSTEMMTDITGLREVKQVFPLNSSLDSKERSETSDSLAIPHLKGTSGNFSTIEKLNECVENGSQLIECFHLLNITSHYVDSSLGGLLQNLCFKPLLSSYDGRESSEKTVTSRADKSFLLKYVASAFSALGILSNLSVSVILLYPKLRKPFYMSVLSLAVADIFYHINFFLNKFFVPSNICEVLKFQNIFQITTYGTKMCSSLNVMVLLSVRYAMFVHPIISRVYLTNRKICVISGLCLMLSIVYGVVIVEVIWTLMIPDTYLLYTADDGLILTVIVLLNIYFVVNRCKTMKSSLAANNVKKRMMITVSLILARRTANSVFSIVQSTVGDSIMVHDPFRHTSFDKELWVVNVSELFKILVHSANPFIYFLSSSNVLKVILSCFQCHFS